MAVTGIRIEKGRVAGILTDRGEIETRIVVNAAGSWGHRVGMQEIFSSEQPLKVLSWPLAMPMRWPMPLHG